MIEAIDTFIQIIIKINDMFYVSFVIHQVKLSFVDIMYTYSFQEFLLILFYLQSGVLFRLE